MNELIYKIETDSWTQKMNLRLPKGKGGREKISRVELTYTHYYI